MNNLIIVMGVSGSGKTLVGQHLARQLDVDFVDGDDLHPAENVERMRAGFQLDDDCRKPWLAAICDCAESHFAAGNSVVIACSALKAKYRDQLRRVSQSVVFVFLQGPKNVIAERLKNRVGHYMPASLLESQFNDLEIPVGEANVVHVDIEQSVPAVLESALAQINCIVGN